MQQKFFNDKPQLPVNDNKDNNNRKSDKPVAPLTTTLPASRAAAKDAPEYVVESIVDRLLTELQAKRPQRIKTYHNKPKKSALQRAPPTKSSHVRALQESKFKKAAIPK